MEGTSPQVHRLYKKATKEDSLKIPSLKTGKISLSDIIAATIGEEARSCDFDNGDVQNEVYGDYGTSMSGEIPQDLNFSFYFRDDSSESFNKPNTNTSIGALLNEHEHSKLQTVPQIDHNSNTGDSFFNENSVGTDLKQTFPTTLSFESQFENNDDFLASLVEPRMEASIDQQGAPELNPDNDSDLEDSMHFVDPDDQSNDIKAELNYEVPEPKLKKRRLSDIQPFSSLNHNDMDYQQSDLITLLYAEMNQAPNINMQPKQKTSAFHRRRSFSGTTTHRLQRQCGVSKLNHRSRDRPAAAMLRANSFSENCTTEKFSQNNQGINNDKTPTMFRTRSFSEACNNEMLTPISEGRTLDTSLSSLLGSPNENSQLSNNPFYEDLKCTLLSDLSNSATDDCPKTLFDTICQGQNSDVYARERNLQSRFSTMQCKYPDEVRDLSSFYRQQSAEIETERFREIHDERFPLSYRNHLNRYYDNLLHTIMERVEKSLHLLSKAKKETCVPVMQALRTRPLLSRKAVSMMEEWYTRNYEHPYPSQTAVDALAAAGQITTEQVKKWFANKRNRNKNSKPMNEVMGMKRKRQFSSRW